MYVFSSKQGDIFVSRRNPELITTYGESPVNYDIEKQLRDKKFAVLA